jgi:nitrate reductase gamma subunit
MNVLYSLIAVLLLVLVGVVAGRGDGGRAFVAVATPYTALAVFLVGFCYRVLRWAWTPVPFRIPTTCGQQKSLPWIKANSIDNPSSGWGVVARMGLEVLAFRSLFRNNQALIDSSGDKNRLSFGENKFLWLGAIAFHWALLIVVLRHLRLLVEPIPAFVLMLQHVDGFFQVTAPSLYASDAILLVALAYLLLRRLQDPLVRYISFFTDYFALFLLLGVAISGMLMRYVVRADITAVKQFAVSLAAFHPIVGGGFPETHAAALSANRTFLGSLRRAAEEGLPIYAECGGLMLLSRALSWKGARYEMADVFPFEVEVSETAQGHGYIELQVDMPNPFFQAGTSLRGHEFHYSRIAPQSDWTATACEVRRGTGCFKGRDAAILKNVWASYTHLHALATPQWVQGLTDAARRFVAHPVL